MYGKKHSEEYKKSRSEQMKEYWKTHEHPDLSGENNGMYGRKHSEEARKRMSESAKKRIP